MWRLIAVFLLGVMIGGSTAGGHGVTGSAAIGVALATGFALTTLWYRTITRPAHASQSRGEGA